MDSCALRYESGLAIFSLQTRQIEKQLVAIDIKFDFMTYNTFNFLRTLSLIVFLGVFWMKGQILPTFYP